MAEQEKKDWEVTLSYNVKHDDTSLIQNVTKDQAKWIAENQNASPNFDCICIKEDESNIEDEETTIKEVKFRKNEKGKYGWFDIKTIEKEVKK